MRLNNVTAVSMDREPLPIGYVVEVSCRDYRSVRGERNIVLVLQM